MGACLCKTKKRHCDRQYDSGHFDFDESSSTTVSSNRSRRGLLHSITSLASQSAIQTAIIKPAGSSASPIPGGFRSKTHKLINQVDNLVTETLASIRSIAETDQEPPNTMHKLHIIAENELGWFVVINSLISKVDIDHPLGPALILLVLEDAPLPSKNAVSKLDHIIRLSLGGDQLVTRHRNTCIVLCCLAEKLAGTLSSALFTTSIQDFLMGKLNPTCNPTVILFSLIALEKFAQTIDNKIMIIDKLKKLERNNPYIELEKWIDSADYVKQQVGFCSKWDLDNYFPYPERPYSYETIETKNVNAVLNAKDASEYIKISADGLVARNDTSSFESVRCTYAIKSGVFYYEVKLITTGVMQIGFSTKESKFLNYDGFGIGDDDQSLAYDGCRQLIWYNARSIAVNQPRWKPGDIVGCLINLDKKHIRFSLNGHDMPACSGLFWNKQDGIDYFAAASFMSFQQCEFNFGSKPFYHPPKKIAFKTFNEVATLKEEDKIIIPRHLSMKRVCASAIRLDSCTICCSEKATVSLEPCKHGGFCENCADYMKNCPLCRTSISSKRAVDEVIENIITDND